MLNSNLTKRNVESFSQKTAKINELLKSCDFVVVGAGAGLSASAGLSYSGERFSSLFSDFIERYNLSDMYSAAFYNHKTPEEHWAYWSRHIHCNRYEKSDNSLYQDLFSLVKDKDYFVVTTNVDMLFVRNGFDKNRLFYTQGDYGLFQCSKPCHNKTYDNFESVTKMIEQQKDFKIPSKLVPTCPVCGAEMTTNLRKDETFVETEGWHKAAKLYQEFLKKANGKNVLFIELGVGYNTPTIIKIPFWQMVYQNQNANYVTINLENACCPKEIEQRSICIDQDILLTIDNIVHR